MYLLQKSATYGQRVVILPEVKRTGQKLIVAGENQSRLFLLHNVQILQISCGTIFFLEKFFVF